MSYFLLLDALLIFTPNKENKEKIVQAPFLIRHDFFYLKMNENTQENFSCINFLYKKPRTSFEPNIERIDDVLLSSV